MNRRDFLKAPAALLVAPALAQARGATPRMDSNSARTPVENAGEREACWGYCDFYSPEEGNGPFAVNSVYGHQLSLAREDALRRGCRFAPDMLMTSRRNCRTLQGVADPDMLRALSRSDLYLAMANPVEPGPWAMALEHCEFAANAGALSILFVPDTYAGEDCDNYLDYSNLGGSTACVLRYSSDFS